MKDKIKDGHQQVIGKEFPPKCHFTHMEFAWADNGNGGTDKWWECKHCRGTKDLEGNSFKQ